MRDLLLDLRGHVRFTSEMHLNSTCVTRSGFDKFVAYNALKRMARQKGAGETGGSIG